MKLQRDLTDAMQKHQKELTDEKQRQQKELADAIQNLELERGQRKRLEQELNQATQELNEATQHLHVKNEVRSRGSTQVHGMDVAPFYSYFM